MSKELIKIKAMLAELEDLSSSQQTLLKYALELVGDAFLYPSDEEYRAKVIHIIESLFNEFPTFRDLIVQYSDAITDLSVQGTKDIIRWSDVHENGSQLILLMVMAYHKDVWKLDRSWVLFDFEEGRPIAYYTRRMEDEKEITD